MDAKIVTQKPIEYDKDEKAEPVTLQEYLYALAQKRNAVRLTDSAKMKELEEKMVGEVREIFLTRLLVQEKLVDSQAEAREFIQQEPVFVALLDSGLFDVEKASDLSENHRQVARVIVEGFATDIAGAENFLTNNPGVAALDSYLQLTEEKKTIQYAIQCVDGARALGKKNYDLYTPDRLGLDTNGQFTEKKMESRDNEQFVLVLLTELRNTIAATDPNLAFSIEQSNPLDDLAYHTDLVIRFPDNTVFSIDVTTARDAQEQMDKLKSVEKEPLVDLHTSDGIVADQQVARTLIILNRNLRAETTKRARESGASIEKRVQKDLRRLVSDIFSSSVELNNNMEEYPSRYGVLLAQKDTSPVFKKHRAMRSKIDQLIAAIK